MNVAQLLLVSTVSTILVAMLATLMRFLFSSEAGNNMSRFANNLLYPLKLSLHPLDLRRSGALSGDVGRQDDRPATTATPHHTVPRYQPRKHKHRHPERHHNTKCYYLFLRLLRFPNQTEKLPGNTNTKEKHPLHFALP